MNILDLPMAENDADAETVRDYFKALLQKLWSEGESFSGKRPFGNSGWENEVYVALVKAEAVSGSLDADGYLNKVDTEAADELIYQAIDLL